LEERGVEVLLVDARKLKNVPGRKTDVLDCQWLQQLHTFGLLSGVFRPADEVCVLRSYMRQRAMLVAYGSHHVQHMQKALTQMNVKLQHVVSDITGVTGMRIIRAIVRGQRDPKALAELRDPRCQKDKETLAKALEGHWREEHLFELQQAVALYDTYQAKIRECDERLEKSLQTFEAHPPGGGRTGPEAKGRRAKNEPGFDVAQYLFRMTGVDLTAVDGLDAHTALKVISEIGLDMGRWPGVKQFTSWLALCPGNKVSGGKRLNGRTRPSANRAASALRLAAQGLHHSDSALGAFFRRMKIRHGTPKAVTATAHRLARIIYSMLRQGSHFVHETAEEYERRYRTQQIEHMKRKAKKLGYELVKIEDPQVESLP
jgi:transposase